MTRREEGGINIKKKFYTARYDVIFKNALCTEENKDLLKWFLEKILDIEIENLILKVHEQRKKKYHFKNKTLDVLVATKKEMINIELNSGFYSSLPVRNMAYICSSYANELDRGEDYRKMRNHIQINFTWNLKENYPLKAVYELTDKKHDIKYVNNFKVIEYNMEKLIKMWYNGNQEVLKYKEVIMLGLEGKGLEEISKGDKMMEKFKENVEKLNEDEELEFLLTEEEDYEKLKNTLLGEARDQGLAEGLAEGEALGLEKGEKNKAIEIAKNLLDLNISISDIIKATGLTEEEILALKNN